MPITKTSWQGGRSGNPRGRPRSGEELAGILRQTIDCKRFAEKRVWLSYWTLTVKPREQAYAAGEV